MFWNGLDAFSFLIRVFQLLFSCGLRLRSWMIRGLRKMFGFSWVFCLNFCIKWHQMTIFFLKWNFEMTQLRIHSSCWFTRPHKTNASRVSDHEILECSIWEWILGDIFSVCTDGLLWNSWRVRSEHWFRCIFTTIQQTLTFHWGEVVESSAPIVLAHKILASLGRHHADLCLDVAQADRTFEI